jgi:hypothetical protein
MEIDFPRVGCFKETETLVGKELGDAAMWRTLMEF